MVFNFTKDYQFSSRLYLGGKLIDTIDETKLLGTIITSDLKWAKNSDMLVKKAYARMRMIQKLKSFGVSREDLVHIYILYIRNLHYRMGGGITLLNTEHILHLGLIKRHFRNNRIWVKFIPGKLSLKSSKGFFPSFRAGRLLKPKNTMYFTHTSQNQHMLKKKSRAN